MQNPNEIKSEEKHMFMALALIIMVLIGFQAFNKKSEPVTAIEETPVEFPVVLPVPEQPVQTQSNKVIEKTFPIENESVSGEILSTGLGIHQWILSQYKETLDKDSPNVQLLSNQYGVDLYWLIGGEKIPLILQSGNKLTQEKPLIFEAKSRDLTLTRQVTLDDNYMVSVVDTVQNTSQKAISAELVGEIYRAQETIQPERSVVHTGFIALVDNKLQENTYDKITKETVSYQTKHTWLGLTDKYWQTVLVPDQNEQVKITNTFTDDTYYSRFNSNALTLGAGQSITRTTRIFIGAKNLNLINHYMSQYGIPKFDLSIDFGWFYFLTKPFLYFLQWLYALVGNMGLAILLFATLLRLLLLPVATKSYVSMAQMKKIQPQLKVLQERYKDDRLRLQQEMMALYKREKVNPAGGCLPMLVQIPVFFALYKVLSVSLQMRQAPFFGWIQDLSMPDSSSVFTLFGLVPWPIPSFLDLGVMPIIMGLTMYIQQKMSPQPAGADKAQMSMFKWMPIIFTFMMGRFAVGLIIYWAWSNLLSIAQQRYIMKKVK